jgi:hypothetical protein
MSIRNQVAKHEWDTLYYTQGNDSSRSGDNVPMTISWRDASIAGGGYSSVSALFRSGIHYVDRLSLLVNDLGSPIPSSGWISVDDLISDVTSSDDICAYLISDVSGILSVAFIIWCFLVSS